jgi:hypothetical protein
VAADREAGCIKSIPTTLPAWMVKWTDATMSARDGCWTRYRKVMEEVAPDIEKSDQSRNEMVHCGVAFWRM